MEDVKRVLINLSGLGSVAVNQRGRRGRASGKGWWGWHQERPGVFVSWKSSDLER
jgi:uncharacterized protein YcaQ